jgi:hypothetical protein
MGGQPLALGVAFRYVIETGSAVPSSWVASIVAYRYQLYVQDGPELLAYHWHPEDPNPVKIPHLHLGAGAQVGFASLGDAHLPTGVVQLAGVLRLSIEEFGVRPLRPDWADVLSATPG